MILLYGLKMLPNNPSCNCYPEGNPVFIQPGHTITMNIGNSLAYSVNIPNTSVLDMTNELYSSLGIVSGQGKLRLESTSGGSFIFPGGNFKIS